MVEWVPAEPFPGHPVSVPRRRSALRRSPEGVCQSTQRQVVEEINRLNGLLAEEQIDPEIQTRISQYEMAFRMQSSVPELTDFRGEPRHVLDLYGIRQPGDGLLPRTACSRGASSSAAFGSFSCTTARGIITATSRTTCP
jgi:hypothetical protein